MGLPEGGPLAHTAGARLMREGRREGRKEGAQVALAKMLLTQAEHRFGSPSAGQRQQILRAPLATLERWTARILDAPSLEALLASERD
ncbi:MAG: DUF4351 domain-containing protein [Polyangiales bacterium]